METPASTTPACPVEIQAPPTGATNPTEGITLKLDYALAIAAPAKTNSKGIRLGDSNVKARVYTNNGTLDVIFKASDYYEVMAVEFKYTITGEFLRTRSILRESGQFLLKRFHSKVTRTIFINVTNDEDCETVWFKRSIEIDGLVM